MVKSWGGSGAGGCKAILKSLSASNCFEALERFSGTEGWHGLCVWRDEPIDRSFLGGRSAHPSRVVTYKCIMAGCHSMYWFAVGHLHGLGESLRTNATTMNRPYRNMGVNKRIARERKCGQV